MQELINQLVEKAGLTEEQAKKASEVAITFVKEKLPAGLGDKVDDMLAGNLDLGSLASSLLGKGGINPMDMLKGMFGGDKK